MPNPDFSEGILYQHRWCSPKDGDHDQLCYEEEELDLKTIILNSRFDSLLGSQRLKLTREAISPMLF